jgi:hypothetical protein
VVVPHAEPGTVWEIMRITKVATVGAEVTFVARSAQDFCGMWTNKSAPGVKLQMQLQHRELKR